MITQDLDTKNAPEQQPEVFSLSLLAQTRRVLGGTGSFMTWKVPSNLLFAAFEHHTA